MTTALLASNSAAESLRVPPHSVEAEQSLLGGLLLDGRAWDEIADLLADEDFYRRDHRLVFAAIRKLSADSTPVDVVTVAEHLSGLGQIDDAGGMPYLGSLVSNVPSAANIKSYAAIIRDRSVLRQLIGVSTDIGNVALEPEGRSVAEILDHAEQQVFDIAEQGSRGKKGYRPIKDLLVDVTERIDHLYHHDGPCTGIPTGFSDLDGMTSGLQPADLVIVAGRPSMGKTTFAMNIVEHVAIKSQKSVAVFSLEMPGEQLVMRLLSSLGRIDQQKIRSGKLADDDWPRLTSAMSILGEARMFIDDTPALSPTELRARARRIKREHDLDLIVIDYLQLMQCPGSENRTNEISEISRTLKAVAKELGVPVIALSQLNRGLEQRPNKRPIMSDLRESGAIEQDADLIAFIYRDEVYNEDSPDKGIAEIIVGKQRNGPIGSVRLTFLGQYTRFENFTAHGYDSEGYA